MRRSRWVLPALLVLLVFVLGWAATPENRRPSLEPAAPGPAVSRELWVDPGELTFDALDDQRYDPRWRDELRLVAAGCEPFRIEDEAGSALLQERLEDVSFVRAAHVLVDAEHGLEAVLDLASPVACVAVGERFLTVDEDGVLLSGFWPRPLSIGGASLPVIGPLEDSGGLLAYARPGDWLAEPEHLDALEVALSLDEHLSQAARERLGRVVIDARGARQASVARPGVRLLLEECRLVLFGRTPYTDEPGELAVERKWGSLERALALLDDPRGARWTLVDVRWDKPELVLEGALLAATGHTAPRPR